MPWPIDTIALRPVRISAFQIRVFLVAAVAFLASPACGFCHAALLDIDGGQTRTL